MADQRPIVTPSALEQLKNTDSLVFGNSIVLVEQPGSLPTPAAGYGILYEKTDGFLYFKNSSGTEYLL